MLEVSPKTCVFSAVQHGFLILFPYECFANGEDQLVEGAIAYGTFWLSATDRMLLIEIGKA